MRQAQSDARKTL